MSQPGSVNHPLTRVGATFGLDTVLGKLEITVCTLRILRVRLVIDGQPAGPTYVEPRNWDPVNVEVEAGSPTVIDTGVFRLTWRKIPFRWFFRMVQVLSCCARRLTTAWWLTACGAAAWRIRQSIRSRLSNVYVSLNASPGPTNSIFMGWARVVSNSIVWTGHDNSGTAILDGPGSDIGVPLLLSTAGYGLFFDNTSEAKLAVGRTEDDDQIVYQVEAGALDWYFLYGTDLRGVLGSAADLLGHALLPPRWALGFLQSTRHFDDTAELLNLPRSLRERHIPCDAIIFLSTYGDATGWNRGVGHLGFQPDLIPRPPELLAELRRQGFQVITHEYPVLHEESPLFAEAKERGYLLDEGYPRRTPSSRPSTNFQEGQRYIDFSNPSAREWWWKQHRRLADIGVGAWWLDGGEGPSSAATLHGGDGLTLHNIYDRYRFQAFAEGEERDYPNRRPFLLCRSGAAGMARFGATCWSGDVNNTFATLEAHVPLGLNTGMSGIPNWGSDIGGFFHPIAESGELFARWFQFGAFSPGFRAHGWVWRDHLMWAHGPEVEAICKRFVELRYQLLPYTYTLAWQAHTSGLPFMRPLVLNYPDDSSVWELGSQYLWGDDLLVAPVTREGATAWPVYLPKGTWYDFWTGQRYEGPSGVTVAAPLDRMPLFVRGGAILPLAPIAQFDGERPWDEILLQIYPEHSSRFALYEDDGRTNAYRQGGYATTTIACTVEGSRTIVTIDPPAGDAAVIPANRHYLLHVLGEGPSGVTFNGTPLLPQDVDSGNRAGYRHDGMRFLHIHLPASHGTVVIER